MDLVLSSPGKLTTEVIGHDAFRKILESFFKNLESEGTRREYRLALNEFFKLLGPSISDAGELRRRHVIFYKNHLEQRKLAPNTINKKLAAVSSFCRFLAQEELMDKDLTYGVKRPRSQNTYQTGFLNEDEVAKIFASLDQKRSGYTKYKLILAFGFYCGLRNSCIRNIRIKDLGIKNGVRMIRYVAKRKKICEKPLHPAIIQALEEHLLFMQKVKGIDIANPEQYLFPIYRGDKDKPMTKDGTRHVFKNALKAAGIIESDFTRYGPHVMRNTFSNNLKANKVPITEICEVLDHSSIQTTQKCYLQAPTPMEKSPIFRVSY